MATVDAAARPAASLLLLAYNHEAFVGDALRSALRQDVGEYEVIVVDDASTDRTRSIMEAVLATEVPAGVTVRRLFRDRNAGLLDAVNEAMAAATGEVFLLAAGDDVSLPCRLSRTLRIFAEKPSVQLVYGECQKIDESGRPCAASEEVKPPRLFTYRGSPAPRIYAGAEPFGTSAAYRRGLYDVFGPMIEGEHGEDNCYWVRALLLGDIYWDPAVYVAWRQHSGNLSNFSAQLADKTWRLRHLAWMENHATMSRQWLKDIARAREASLITSWRARALTVAALREDRTWALAASSLRGDLWSEWVTRALRLLLVGRILTIMKQLCVRLSLRCREKKWRFWAKLKSNPAS
jgi:glycosyltransferase involved in cell wall biosynthesis